MDEVARSKEWGRLHEKVSDMMVEIIDTKGRIMLASISTKYDLGNVRAMLKTLELARFVLWQIEERGE